MTDTPQTYRPDADWPMCVVTNGYEFVCKAADVETAARIVQALNLFQYIQEHEASDGVIAKRLLWAVEAEKALVAASRLLDGIAFTEPADVEAATLIDDVLAKATPAPPRAVEEGE